VNQRDAELVTAFLLGNLEMEVPITLRVFGAVPEGQLDYRPDPVSKTALELLRHITLEDEWFLDAIVEGRFGDPPDESDSCGIHGPADAAVRYRERVPALIARVRSLSGEALVREIDLLGMLKLPAVQFLSMVLRHSAHHRGQLSAYLRAMGGKVPAIYGPSADTKSTTA
jgi:uncharacterized damage-inducible protein DinB